MKSLPALQALCIVLSVAGCASLPGTGPSTVDVALTNSDNADALAREFAVVKLTPALADQLGEPAPQIIPQAFRSNAPSRSGRIIGVGDQLSIAVWESSPDGLFSTSEQKSTALQTTVGTDGTIFFPYVGQIQVEGRSVEDARRAIADGLQGKAVEPQVQVELTGKIGRELSVEGDVNHSGRFDVPENGMRLLDAVALAGGPAQPAYDTELTLLRAGRTADIRLESVVERASNNVWMHPGDVVQVTSRPRSFMAFGAVRQQSLNQLKTQHVTLAQGLAQAGGLNDSLADAGGVFLFRYESPERLRAAGVSLPQSWPKAGVPTIYQVDFRSPQAFFLAGNFAMQDQDMIYVANAPAAELRKFMQIILSPFVSTVSDVNDLN
ncbi:polysaccharide biosynthesis/export family protein [Pseudooceanicola sp. CBS1P-1]|uniref:Polysaccharide export protein n=1 Tax=Pseudooceanicola albus TaxID=2692189 RepID=A0A6L7G821_9RHOB|nr:MULTISPECIES: polysaccharide biosynthesis/export family protein [Pseudooceanicola]MBT9382901.1 polysaccharide biosynthesis/export family protein [Pseudooceanicola endophyticus]MXN20175.1 polysaccharide export protein [Pseudooceanicola albus]